MILFHMMWLDVINYYINTDVQQNGIHGVNSLNFKIILNILKIVYNLESYVYQ